MLRKFYSYRQLCKQHSFSPDPLLLEMEVEELKQKIQVLEEGQQTILAAQESIRKVNSSLLQRLDYLEQRDRFWQRASGPASGPFTPEYPRTHHYHDPSYQYPPFEEEFESPYGIFPSSLNNTAFEPGPYESTPSRRRGSPVNLVLQSHHTPAIRPEPSAPSVNTTPTPGQQGTSSAPFQSAPLPIKAPNPDKALPSNVIQKEKLMAPNEIFVKYPNLHCALKAKTLAVKLARDAIFGDDVLIRCTVAGGRDHPGLPVNELSQLKQVLFMQFPQFWPSPIEFEPLWKDCVDSIGQACKRLRFKKPGQN